MNYNFRNGRGGGRERWGRLILGTLIKIRRKIMGVLKQICKLKLKMQTAVKEELLRYLQSGT